MAIDINGRSLVPNIAGQFALGQQTSNTLDNQRLQGQAQQFNLDQAKAGVLGKQQASDQEAAQRAFAGQVLAGNLPEGMTQQQAMGQVFTGNQDLFDSVSEQLGLDSDQKKLRAATFGSNLLNTPFPQRAALIQQEAEKIRAEGGDPQHTLDLANLDEESQNRVGRVFQINAMSPENQFKATQGGEAGGVGVQSSQFIPGVGFATLSKAGEANLVPVEGVGETVEVKREADIAKSARIEERKALLKGKSDAIKLAINRGGQAFDRIQPISTAIANYDEAIKAIDSGADTGVVTSMLPSFKKASIELDNVIKRLGLDVVGNTTFGALSESELAFALKAAAPDNLQPADLKQWLIAKRDAQKKVKERVEEAATFLSTGTNTLADWVEFDKAKQLNQANAQQQQSANQQIPEMLARPEAAAASDLSGLSLEDLMAERTRLGGQ